MELELAITAFATLFVMIDPIGISPLFVALTSGMEPKQRRAVARRACFTAFLLLSLFGLAGEVLLGAIGISMAAFRISGGLLLFLTAIDMLFERRTKRREKAIEDANDPSVFPLATPLIAGPGALATMILLMGEAQSWQAMGIVQLVMMLVVSLVFALSLMGASISRLLGHTGINVLTRLFGMLLAALSVQFVIDGLRETGLVGTL